MITRRHLLKLGTGFGLLAVTPQLALAGSHARVGTFTGAARYGIGGQAQISGDTITLLSDFKFGNAPDPKVALGRNGYDAKTLMGPLKSKTGQQSYKVPAGIDTSQYNEVWIWCEKFNVPLGVATIN